MFLQMLIHIFPQEAEKSLRYLEEIYADIRQNPNVSLDSNGT
jgi:hypothetical protein